MSSNEEVVVVARWRIAPASFDDVLAAATELRLASLAEPGCLGYELFQPVAGAGGRSIIRKP